MIRGEKISFTMNLYHYILTINVSIEKYFHPPFTVVGDIKINITKQTAIYIDTLLKSRVTFWMFLSTCNLDYFIGSSFVSQRDEDCRSFTSERVKNLIFLLWHFLTISSSFRNIISIILHIGINLIELLGGWIQLSNLFHSEINIKYLFQNEINIY